MAKIRFSPHFVLAPRADGTQRAYKVSFVYTSADGEDTAVQFVARRRFLGKAEAGVFLCELTRDALTSDQPDNSASLLDDLAARCGAVLYPMPVRLHHAGHALSLSPDRALSTRWSALKPELEEYFCGEATVAYLAAMDRQMHDAGALNAAVCEALFFQTFFAPVYQPYGDGLPLDGTLYYKVLPAAPSVAFTCSLQVEEETSEQGGAIVSITGRCADKRGADDLLAGQALSAGSSGTPVSGTVSLRYTLQPGTHALQSLNGFFDLYEDTGGDEGAVRVGAVEVFMAHLPEEDVLGPSVLPLVSETGHEKKRWHFF